jgi:hypothetical protein
LKNIQLGNKYYENYIIKYNSKWYSLHELLGIHCTSYR